MGSVDKEQLERVRAFLKENPYEARKLISEQPELFNALLDNQNGQSNNQSKGDNSIGGKQLVKTNPGARIPKMFVDWDEQGFSNYLMLAVLTFSIQLIITLICIFFYK